MDLSKAVWRKATMSGENGGACVELAPLPDAIAVRDSKDPAGPKVILERGEFQRFAAAIKRL